MKHNANEILIGMPYITQPNYKGVIVRETATQIIVKITGRDFTPKSSARGLTMRFSASARKWYNERTTSQERRYWKASGKRVGVGNDFIVNHVLVFGLNLTPKSN